MVVAGNTRTPTPTRTPTGTASYTATPSATVSLTPTISPTFSATPVARYALRLSVFDSAGREIRVLTEGFVPGPPSQLGLSADPYEVGGPLLAISSDSGNLGYWDGMASDGARAYPGVYHIRARYQEIGKDLVEMRSIALSLLWRGSDVLSSAILGPNPSSGFVRLAWKPVPGYTIRAKIYNVAGELIRIVIVDSNQGIADWDLGTVSRAPVSNGVYIWALELLNSRNEVVERGFEKHVIMRK